MRDRVWIALAWVLAGAALVTVLALAGHARPARTSPAALFQIDADPVAPGIQTSVSIPPGSSFRIRWNVDPRDTGPYSGYQGKMAFEETVVNVTAGTPLGVVCVAPPTDCLTAAPVISNEPDALGQGTIFAGEGRFSGTTTFSGDVFEVTLLCLVAGTSALDLRPPPTDPLGQNTSLVPTAAHPTDTVDAQVVCDPSAPPPPTVAPGTFTPTPPAGASPMPTAPGGTPAAPTPTPLPGPREQISLEAGCNLRSFLPYYPDGVNLVAVTVDINRGNPRIWLQRGVTEFDLFDPRSAERSTVTVLTQEAGFICIDEAAVWNRPLLS